MAGKIKGICKWSLINTCHWLERNWTSVHSRQSTADFYLKWKIQYLFMKLQILWLITFSSRWQSAPPPTGDSCDWKTGSIFCSVFYSLTVLLEKREKKWTWKGCQDKVGREVRNTTGGCQKLFTRYHNCVKRNNTCKTLMRWIAWDSRVVFMWKPVSDLLIIVSVINRATLTRTKKTFNKSVKAARMPKLTLSYQAVPVNNAVLIFALFDEEINGPIWRMLHKLGKQAFSRKKKLNYDITQNLYMAVVDGT